MENKNLFKASDQVVTKQEVIAHLEETLPATMYVNEMRRYLIRDLINTIPTENAWRDGLQDTPARVAAMYDEIFAGYMEDPAEVLGTTFPVGPEGQEMIVVGNIPFYSHCEHHMVPFFGKAHIGYIPNESIVGLSKLARIVNTFARRLQIQENLTYQIADAIDNVLAPLGVIVVIEAEHLCIGMRGVEKPGTITTTSAIRGVFTDSNNQARAEFLQLIGRK